MIVGVYRNRTSPTARRVRRPVPRPARPVARGGSARSSSRRSPARTGAATRSGPMLQRIYGTAWESQEGARRAPAPARGGREARPPQARRRARPVLVPRGDRLRASRSSTRRAASSARSWRTTRAQRHEAAGYEFVNSPHITKADLFETSGHLDWFADGMFPPMELDGGTRLLPQADELPVPHPDLPEPHAVVPRAAAAAVRVRHGVPLREVGRGARPDARARA